MPTLNNNKRNIKQDIDIASILVDIGWIKGKISLIEQQVFNEIPHKLDEITEAGLKDRDEIRKERMQQIEGLQTDIKDINNKILWGFIIGIASILIMQVALKLF